MIKSRYILSFLCLLLVSVNVVVAYGQTTACQIGYLVFHYPNTVNAGQQVKVITGVNVFYCTLNFQEFRVDLYNAQHAVLSSNSTIGSATASSGILANVTNVISVPPVAGDYVVYATAYAISMEGNSPGSVMGTYQTSFTVNVILN